LGPLLRVLGSIPVNRDEADGGAIRSVVDALRGGSSVVIHPQGTFLGASDRRWRRGAARGALETGVALVPVLVVNTERVMKPGSFRVGFPRVRVLVGETIDPGPAREPTPAEATALIEQVRVAVERLRA